MKTILIFVVSVFFSVSAFANATSIIDSSQNVQLIGSITDDKNKEALAGATIYIDGKKYYSDFDGNFSIPNMKPGKYQVKVELISYKSVIVEIDVNEDEKININLLQS